MSNIVKSKFAGLLRGLLRRFDDSDSRTVVSPRPEAAAAPACAMPPAAPQFKPQPVHSPPAASLGDLQLPLSSIIPVLPVDLRAKLLTQKPPAAASVSIPVEKALSQLAHGSVKISFGELCAALPGLFDHSGDNEARQIVLPLNEIISRINPALLSRRAAKKIEVADDIASPFSARTPGAGFAPAQAPVKPATTTPPKAPEPARASPTPSPAAPPPRVAPKTMPAAAKPAPAAPTPAARVAVPPAPIPFSSAPAASAASLGNLQLPLSSIMPVLPVDLRAKLLMQTPAASASVSIPVEKALSQLAHGSVKISFGELCAALPGLFDRSGDNDARQIALPLNEIITRINPALLSRRTAKKIELADDIASPFSARTPDAAAQAPAKAAPIPPPKTPEPAPATATSTPAATPPAVAPKTMPAAAKTDPTAPTPSVTTAADFNFAPKIPVTATPIAAEVSIFAPLSALVEKWPDAIKMELVQANLMNAQAALPASLVEPGLKRGRVTIPWKNLRMMIRPNPPPVSVHDGVELELPLKVLAPLFFASQKAAGLAKQKVSVSAEIPNLFQDSKKMEAAQPPAPAPVPVPIPAAAVPAKPDMPDVFSKARTPGVAVSEPEASGSDFKPPAATPRDIAARAAALPGVAGAVIALYDGLMIASEVPPDFNADTAAAFLPQIYDRVAHCTRELRMGALNKLEFTVGDVSWHIFRVNAIYFAAFGHAGKTLPTAQLVSLAGELDRKKE